MIRNHMLSFLTGIAVLIFSQNSLAGELPNVKFTQGVARNLPLSQICTTKWGVDARAVTPTMKATVYKKYGMVNKQGDCALSPRGCEVDHLISRELGGADDIKNLWPQPYGGVWNASVKDKLENRLHTLICAKKPTITLKEAQGCLVNNWINCYKKIYP